MKRLFIGSALLCTFLCSLSLAQHRLQLDAGGGKFGIIQGSSTWPVGVTTFTLPPGGDTIVTQTTLPNLAWVLTGNTLAGGAPATPIQRFGSNNNFDVIFVRNGAEQFRLGGLGTFFTTDLTANANTFLNGNVGLGNAPADAITLSGTLTGAGAGHSLGTLGLDANVLTINGDDNNVGNYELRVNGDMQVTGVLSLPALTGNSVVVTDAAGNIITDNPPFSYNPTTNVLTTNVVVPQTDNTYTLGTDLLRWADVYVNGASVHIGPTGGEAGNTELNLGYAANVATINVNGGASEVQIDGTTGNVGVGAAADATNKLRIHNAAGAGAQVLVTGSAPGINLSDVGNAAFGTATLAGQWSTSTAAGDAVLRSSAHQLHLQSGLGPAAVTITTANRVGVGLTNPSTLLANTSANITDQSGDGLNSSSIAWRANAGGYVLGLENLDLGVNPHGLLVKTSSTIANTRVLTLTAGGADIFRVFGDSRVVANGSVTLGDAATDAHTINGAFDANDNGNIIGDNTSAHQLDIDGVADAVNTDAFASATWDLAVDGDIAATGIIKSGASITIDGVSATRAITSDAAMSLVTTTGNLILDAATNIISTNDNFNPALTDVQALGTAALRWDVFADNVNATSITLPVGSFPDDAVFYSNSGSFAAEAAFSYNDGTNVLTVEDLDATASVNIPTTSVQRSVLSPKREARSCTALAQTMCSSDLALAISH